MLYFEPRPTQFRTEVATFSALKTRVSSVSNVLCVLPSVSEGFVATRLQEFLPEHVKLICGICTTTPVPLNLNCESMQGSIDEIIQEANRRKIQFAVCPAFYSMDMYANPLLDNFEGDRLLLISDSMYMLDYADTFHVEPRWTQTECEKLEAGIYDSIYMRTFIREP